MRIFHIITHFDIGGAERVAVNIAKSQTTGMEYHLVEVVRGNGEFSQAFIKELHDCGICSTSTLPVAFHSCQPIC